MAARPRRSIRHCRPTLIAVGMRPSRHSWTIVLLGIFSRRPASVGVRTSSRSNAGGSVETKDCFPSSRLSPWRMAKGSSRSVSTARRDTDLDGRGIRKRTRAPSEEQLELQRDVRLANDLYERAHRAGHDVSLHWAMTQIVRSPVESDDVDALLVCARDRGTTADRPLSLTDDRLIETRLKSLRAYRRSLGAVASRAGRRKQGAVKPVEVHLDRAADELYDVIEQSRDELSAALEAVYDDALHDVVDDDVHAALAAASTEDLDDALNAEVQAAMAATSVARAETVAEARRKRRRKVQSG